MQSSINAVEATTMNAPKARNKVSAKAMLALLSMGLTPCLQALPGGGVVTQGNANINPVDGNNVEIVVNSNRAVIEWGSYNLVDPNDTVVYTMDQSASVLNIINQGSASEINGLIVADGRLLLINTYGFEFGSMARISAGSLIASTLSVDAADFMDGGDLNFFAGSAKGNIINNGRITVDRGNSVALLGNAVINSGEIIADDGSVTLAAGETMTLDFNGDGLWSVAVSDAVSENIGDVAAAVDNSGYLAGAYIVLEANVVADIFTQAVNHEGLIEAVEISPGAGGTVRLTSNGGAINPPGDIQAVAIDIDQNLPAPPPEPEPGPNPDPEPGPQPQPDPNVPSNPTPPGNGGPVAGGGDTPGNGDGSGTPQQPDSGDDDGPVSLLSALANSDDPAANDGIGSTSNTSLGLYNVESPGVRLPADQLEEEL